MNNTNNIHSDHLEHSNIVWVFTDGSPSIEKGSEKYEEHLQRVYDPKPLPEESEFKYISHGLGKTFTATD